MPTRPEEQLLRACMRWSLGAVGQNEILRFATTIDNWPEFLRLAEDHGLSPLAADCLQTCGAMLPREVAQILNAAFRKNASRVLILTAELKRLLPVLQQVSPDVICIKGPSLAHAFYPEPGHRVFGDLDVMVARADLDAMLLVLYREGYRESGDEHQRLARQAFRHYSAEIHLEHQDRHIMVDLHWALLPIGYPARVPQGFRERLITLQIGEVTTRTLSPEDYVLYLCLHATRHEWQRWDAVLDLCRILQKSTPLDYPEMLRQATESGASRAFWFGLTAAADLLEGTETALAKIVAEAPTDINDGRAMDIRQLSDSRLAHWRYVAMMIMMPTEADWESWRIPWRRLFFLYYPWRLVRLARKHLVPVLSFGASEIFGALNSLY